MEPDNQQPSSPSKLSAKERRRLRGRFSNVTTTSVVEQTSIHEATDDEELENQDRLSVGDGDIAVEGQEYEIPEEDLNTFDEKIARIAPRIPDLDPEDERKEDQDQEEADSQESESEDEGEHQEEELREVPMVEDKDYEASVLSDLEVVRGQMTSLQAELASRDTRIQILEKEVKRLNLAIQNMGSSESSQIMGIIGALKQDVKSVRAEMTGWQERRQDELQLSEQKMKKDMAKSTPAPIIAASADVPSSLITPGEGSAVPIVHAASKAPTRPRKKAVRYD